MTHDSPVKRLLLPGILLLAAAGGFVGLNGCTMIPTPTQTDEDAAFFANEDAVSDGIDDGMTAQTSAATGEGLHELLHMSPDPYQPTPDPTPQNPSQQ